MRKPDKVLKNLSVIKKVIKDNNKYFVSKTLDELSLVYLGFCIHFFSYLDAYNTLFLQKNYYSCLGIHRILIDLYIKVRLLDTVPQPEKLAQWILKDNQIKKYKTELGIKPLSDINLCKYFDKIDKNYDSEKFSDTGWLENQYKLYSTYVHPTYKSCSHFLLRKAKDISNPVEDFPIRQDEAEQFEFLSLKLLEYLTNLFVKICKKYDINDKISL